jgi:hypothetical protein
MARVRLALPRMRAVGLAALTLAMCSACDADLQKILDDLSGKPRASGSSDTVSQTPLNIPSGPHLYCITNIGHTLVLYDLAADLPQTNLQRFLDLDPVGPWFSGRLGYYISRVDTSGRGANALVEFDPKTALGTRELGLGINTNPNSLLILPGYGGVAWIAVRGSTFNTPYGPDGIGVVNLNTMTGNLLCFAASSVCPNVLGFPVAANPASLHSLISFVWDSACPAFPGSPCVYAIVNGFTGISAFPNPFVTLLVLKPNVNGNPVWMASVALGTNPLEDMYLDATRGNLWVVNNGDFSPGGQATLQAINTTTLGNNLGTPTATSSTATGIFGFDANTGWVTTYPNDHVQTVNLSTGALTANPGLPNFTGSVVHTTLPGAQLYAGAGGFGAATLVQLSTSDGHQLAANGLAAGNGTVSCGQFATP